MWNYILLYNFFVYFVSADSKLTYHSYNRVPVTDEEKYEYEAAGTAETCLVTFEPCDENEWRRYDGTCNNLKYPSHGSINTPEWRMVPAQYGEGYEQRKMKSGESFPLARAIRNRILEVGGGIDQKFTQGASYFVEFTSADMMTIHDIENYVLKKTYCCKPEGSEDPWCISNPIPEDDGVHRFSGHRCINMTKQMTFQNMGCTTADSTPSRVNRASVPLDLTPVYFYNGSEAGAVARRTFEGGKLKTETVNGITLASDATENTTCFIKQAKETGCTRNVANTIAGTNVFSTLFHRLHNYFADGLAENNPEYDDNTLFHAAMDMNIAFYVQMMLYEFYPEVLGKEHMIEEGIITEDGGFRDIYDPDIAPAMSSEYMYALRWFHCTQEGNQELYDKDHNFIRNYPMVNYTLVVHDLAYDDHMVGVTHSLFLQPAARFDDNVIDADMANRGLGPFQDTLDIPTNDLAKGRDFGMASYADYRNFFVNYTKNHTTFEDFKDLFTPANLEELKKIYKEPENVEFMAGAWLEILPEGAWVAPSIRSIIVNQLKRTIVTDRHWYERPNRPHAFNSAQLAEMRKSSFATLLCTVGDEVLRIQPKAFLRAGPGNEIVSCSEIPKIDMSAWKESSDVSESESSDCSD